MNQPIIPEPILIEQIALEHGCSAAIYEMPPERKRRYQFIIWGPSAHEEDLIILNVLLQGASNDLGIIRRCLPDWAKDALSGRHPRQLDIH